MYINPEVFQDLSIISFYIQKLLTLTRIIVHFWVELRETE